MFGSSWTTKLAATADKMRWRGDGGLFRSLFIKMERVSFTKHGCWRAVFFFIFFYFFYAQLKIKVSERAWESFLIPRSLEKILWIRKSRIRIRKLLLKKNKTWQILSSGYSKGSLWRICRSCWEMLLLLAALYTHSVCVQYVMYIQGAWGSELIS